MSRRNQILKLGSGLIASGKFGVRPCFSPIFAVCRFPKTTNPVFSLKTGLCRKSHHGLLFLSWFVYRDSAIGGKGEGQTLTTEWSLQIDCLVAWYVAHLNQ